MKLSRNRTRCPVCTTRMVTLNKQISDVLTRKLDSHFGSAICFEKLTILQASTLTIIRAALALNVELALLSKKKPSLASSM
ncbi:MAG: hypothetical protein ABF838_13560 [Lentilactobacillus hilgardii]